MAPFGVEKTGLGGACARVAAAIVEMPRVRISCSGLTDPEYGRRVDPEPVCCLAGTSVPSHGTMLRCLQGSIDTL
jgi:hypothetical protein